MNGTTRGLTETLKHLNIGRIQQVGTRTCEQCRNDVPIMQREDVNGIVHEESVCLQCENQELKNSLPKIERKEDREKIKAHEKNMGFIKRYERIPPALQDATFKNYSPENENEEQAKEKAIEYVKNFGALENHSMIFRGPMGIGKSHLARCISRNLKEFGNSAIFLRTDDFLELIRSTFNWESPLTETELFERLGSMDLVVLDEVGAEYHKKQNDQYETWASEKILKLVDMRETLPMIFTTNYDPNGLIQKYGTIQGGRIVSRMKHGALGVQMNGRDRRLEQGF